MGCTSIVLYCNNKTKAMSRGSARSIVLDLGNDQSSLHVKSVSWTTKNGDRQR